MAKNLPTAEEILAGAGALPTVPTMASSDVSVEQLQKRYWQLQVKQLERQTAEIDEAERTAKEARRQNAAALLSRAAEDEHKQRLCPHMKPNYTTAISGQRDHRHVTHFICAYCAKTFTNETLPPMLFPPADRIGGPNQ